MTVPAGAVCLDAQGAQNPHHPDRGIARYVAEHVRVLSRVNSDAIDSVLINPALPLTGNLGWLLGSGLLRWTTADRRVRRQPGRRRPIYHVMSPFEMRQSIDELWPAWARHSDVRLVTTLYDVIPLVFSEHYLRDSATKARYEARSTLVRRADRVLAISQSTADDAIERLRIDPERVSVIHAGATRKFAEMYGSAGAAQEALARRLRSIRPGYLLYVGGFEFRKNLERLIQAYGLLSPDTRALHQLVIACSLQPSEIDLLRRWAADANVRPEDLAITGYVTDEDLGALYRACALFVFASFYEGSGLPILEAMSCDAPVAASNTSTSPEILGDLDGTFDPYDPEDIAECLASLLASPASMRRLVERSRRRVAHYTWESVANSTLEAYDLVIEQRPVRSRARRARLALVSPWPPEQSGVADYNFRLARELGKHIDVDIVVARPIDSYARPLEEGVRLVHTDSFATARALRQPDRTLYCMGNSAFHRHVYDLLRHHPGAVVAHDVRFTGFYGWLSAQERPHDPASRLAEHIYSLYGSRVSAAVAPGSWPTWEQQAAMGIYMTGEIQRYADHLFVHSRHAEEVLQLDRDVLSRDVEVSVLPFALPPKVERIWRSHGDSPLVVSVGVVSEVKGLATLISATALVAEKYENTQLMIAGPAEQAELKRWQDFALETAPNLRVQLTGHLAMSAYRELLQEADIAVQLRTISHGEASAAIGDCLAAGVPTIVSDIGWAAELPADVVARVPAQATTTGLAAYMQELLADEQALRSLSANGQRYACASSISHVAEEYIRALDLS